MRAKKFRNKVKNYQVICTLLIGTSLLGTSYAHWAETLSIETNITTGKIEVDVEQPLEVYEIANEIPIGYRLTNTGTVPVTISLLDVTGEDITICKIVGDNDNWYEEGVQLQIGRDDLNQSASPYNGLGNMNIFDLLATKLVIQDSKVEGSKESIIGIDESISVGFDDNAYLEEVIRLLNFMENEDELTTGGILIKVNVIAKYNGWDKEITLEIPIKNGDMNGLDLGPVGGGGGIALLPAPLPEEVKPEVPQTKPTPPPVEVPEVLPAPETKPEMPETRPTPPPVEVPEVLPAPEEKPEEPEMSPEPIPAPDEEPESLPEADDIQEEAIVD